MFVTSNCDAPRVWVLGVGVHSIDWEGTLRTIRQWALRRESRYVCLTNTHSIVTSTRSEELENTLTSADLALPDGAPVAWMIRRLGFPGQQRINGPDLMWRYCEEASNLGQPIYLFGSTPEVLRNLTARLLAAFPGLCIVGAWSPPFRPMTEQEDAQCAAEINASGARVVFVSLGCPKQEKWMAGHRGQIQAVMIGVGAAFDFHAGTLKRAPPWMRSVGLEWMHRLVSEPRRLWRRYLVSNSIFVAKAALQLSRLWLKALFARDR